MATFHMTVNRQPRRANGLKVSALDHYSYITRTDKYAAKDGKNEDLIYKEESSSPVKGTSMKNFWDGADQFGRKNANAYRECVIALQNEFSLQENIDLIHKFMTRYGIDKQPYTFAIHSKKAAFNHTLNNIHVHLMFSEKTPDGRDLTMQEFFSRYTEKDGEKIGGAKWNEYFSPKETLYSMRKYWADLCNEKFAEKGIDKTISEKTLKLQREELVNAGRIDEAEMMNRIPMKHAGPIFKDPMLQDEIIYLADRFEDYFWDNGENPLEKKYRDMEDRMDKNLNKEHTDVFDMGNLNREAEAYFKGINQQHVLQKMIESGESFVNKMDEEDTENKDEKKARQAYFELEKRLLAAQIATNNICKEILRKKARINAKKQKMLEKTAQQYGLSEEVNVPDIAITAWDVAKELEYKAESYENNIKKVSKDRETVKGKLIDMRNHDAVMSAALNKMTDGKYGRLEKEVLEAAKYRSEEAAKANNALENGEITKEKYREFRDMLDDKYNRKLVEKNKLQSDILNNQREKYKSTVNSIHDFDNRNREYLAEADKWINDTVERVNTLKEKAKEIRNTYSENKVIAGSSKARIVKFSQWVNGKKQLANMPFAAFRNPVTGKDELYILYGHKGKYLMNVDENFEAVKAGEALTNMKAYIYKLNVIITNTRIEENGKTKSKLHYKITGLENTGKTINLFSTFEQAMKNPKNEKIIRKYMKEYEKEMSAGKIQNPKAMRGKGIMKNAKSYARYMSSLVNEATKTNLKGLRKLWPTTDLPTMEERNNEMARVNKEMENGEFINSMRNIYNK